MNTAGKHFFTGTTLSQQQRADIGTGNLFSLAHDQLNGFTVTNDPAHGWTGFRQNAILVFKLG